MYPRPLFCASCTFQLTFAESSVTPSLMPAATNIVRYRVERGLEGVVAASWGCHTSRVSSVLYLTLSLDASWMLIGCT